MRHITSLQEAQPERPSVVTIGAFDGVHRGHQFLVRELVEYANEHSLTPTLLTFHPHPEMVLRGYQPGFYLTLPERKAQLLGDLGVELVVTHPFDEQVRHVRAADFVTNLLKSLNMCALWVGEDFAMGYQREGNVVFLQAQGEARGFQVRIVDLMNAGGERVSSSRIRQLLRGGNVREAACLLGRPHSVAGEVVRGDQRGHAIGIPTANLAVPPDLAIPARGVYAGGADADGSREAAVVNIGVRPTFDGTGALTIEAPLLDYTGDLYGKTMEVSFIDRLRDEKKFDGIDALVAQIRKDIGRARDLLGKRAPEEGITPADRSGSGGG